MPKQQKSPAAKKPADTHNHTHDNHVHTSLVGENIKFKLTIPWSEIQKAYGTALDRFVQAAELDGFRKGKAPRALVEEKVGKSKIYEATIDLVLPERYAATIREKNLKPVAAPHVHPIALEENKDWVFEIETAEAPKVKLGEYKDIVKTVRAKNALWTPGKDQKPQEPEKTEEEKLKQIFAALLEHIHVTIPEILIREEVNQNLSQLVRQLEKMRIPLEDYLKSINKTTEELRQEYAMSALTTLQLEFIIAAIAAQEKITAGDKEVDEVLQALPDEGIRKANNTPTQRMNIQANLVKRKTVEYLLSL